MMDDAVLQHLARITAPRDHHQVDEAMLQAIHALLGQPETRIYDLYSAKNALLVRPRLSMRDGVIRYPHITHTDPDKSGEPLEQYPVLRGCIERHQTTGHDVAGDGRVILWLPLWQDDSVQTVFALYAPHPFDAAAMTLLNGLMSVYSNYQNLLDYSQRDSLTGLLNRKTFDENFTRMVNETPQAEADAGRLPTDRRNVPLTREHWLAVVDIDHFKKVNDVYGHLYGDEVLILVANILRASFRSHDRVFRFGGEEFVIMLRSVTLDEAYRIFERFRINVERHQFPQVGRVTVSVGFSHIVNDTPVVILGHADQALYFAKENGRNQVCYYDELVRRGQVKSQVTNEAAEFF